MQQFRRLRPYRHGTALSNPLFANEDGEKKNQVCRLLSSRYAFVSRSPGHKTDKTIPDKKG
jgi:hypothetical protein